MSFADQLHDEIVNSKRFPLEREADVRDEIKFLREIYYADADRLRYRHAPAWLTENLYIPSTWFAKLVTSFVGLIFGQTPTAVANHEADQPHLDRIIRQNRFWALLRAMEEIRQRDGEAWWALKIDRSIDDVPLIDKTDRLHVVPKYLNNRLVAAAIYSEWEEDTDGAGKATYRSFEVHERGRVRYFLTKGSDDGIGEEIPLASHPATANLPKSGEWNHRLPRLLCGCRRLRDHENGKVGRSLVQGSTELLLEINADQSLNATAARLAKMTLIVDEDLLEVEHTVETADGGERTIRTTETLDMSKHVIGVPGSDNTNGGDRLPIYQANVTYDADRRGKNHEGLIRRLFQQISMAIGLIDPGNSPSDSGSALKAEYLDTHNVAALFGADWDDEVPEILRLAALLDAASKLDGVQSFHRPWRNPFGLPVFTRGPILPDSPSEEADYVSKNRAAGTMSQEEALRRRHPNWPESVVQQHIKLINDELDATAARGAPAPVPAAEADADPAAA